MRTKVTAHIKRIILRLYASKPYLGVRGIAIALKESYRCVLSKSAISTVLRSRGIRTRAGRKDGYSRYQRAAIKGFGFLLLSCFDARIGIFEHIAKELRVYMPKLSYGVLARIIRLVSCAAASDEDFERIVRDGSFLRGVGLHAYSSREVSYFLKRIEEYKPAINCQQVRDNARLVSTVKFYFEDGTSGYCDAKFSTLWDAPCTINHFFEPFQHTLARVEHILSCKLLMLSYTKSFDSLSAAVMRFIDGLGLGIKAIEFLGDRGQRIERKTCAGVRLSFCIGYYPKILNKGIFFLEKAKRFRRIRTAGADVMYTAVSTRFVQEKTKRGIILNNVLLKRRERMLPAWGMLTDKKERYETYLSRYLAMWPSMEDTFKDEMKIIERFFVTETPDRHPEKLIPEKMVFESKEDFSKIVVLLSTLAKEEFGALDYGGLEGSVRRTRDAYMLYSRLIPVPMKKAFNGAGFSIEGKRALLV
ncbi:MAG: hypothetical protein ABH865_01420 [Candidatus Omnitrophota bacterium]